MPSRSPYSDLVNGIVRAVVDIVTERGGTIEPREVMLQIAEPPSPDLGDLGVMVARFAKRARLKPIELAEEVSKKLGSAHGVARTRVVGGYVNVFYSSEYLARLVLESIHAYKDYGNVPAERKLRIIVEHTSANPIHPLHIGHARNSFLGDTLANLLRARGHIVQTRFYVDDTGRQVAILALGYKLLGEPEPPPNVKPDEWLGRIYALTNLLFELKSLRGRIRELEQRLKAAGDTVDDRVMEEYRELIRRQDEIASDLGRLWEEDKELFDRLSTAVMGFPRSFDEEVSRIMRGYERGEEWAKRLVRRVIEIALTGIRETLERLGIFFDKWDYESELVWRGLVDEVIKRARRTPYFITYKGAEALDLRRIAADKDLRNRLRITVGDIPPLILRRSDGTTLYTTKDIAYTIYKFRDFNADRVINVIGAEQRLPQAQVKLALYVIGFRREAENLITYIYEMVILPGIKMSSRRYRIVTLDWVLEELYSRAKEEVDRRRSDLDDAERRRIAWSIAKAAIKFQLAGADPMKPLSFVFDKALSIKENSAPYLMYTYARANSVLTKAGGVEWSKIDYRALGSGSRRMLVWLLGKYPWVVSKAADDLAPELLASYLLRIADEFNKWYGEERIIDESDSGAMNLKLAITFGVRHVIGHGLRIFGIEPLPRI